MPIISRRKRGGNTVTSREKVGWVAEFVHPFLPQNAGGIGLLNEVSVHCIRHVPKKKVAFLKRTPLCHTRNKKKAGGKKKKKEMGAKKKFFASS